MDNANWHLLKAGTVIKALIGGEVQMKMPNSVCWNITSQCNDNCLFCYRDRDSREMDFEKQKIIVEKIADSGIRKVTFAGGEPLMVKNLRNLILYAKEKGLIVSLTTNGILLTDEWLEFCMRNLDWITFSLDGVDEKTQSAMGRNSEHTKRTRTLLKKINSADMKTCRVKINTVVSHVNQDHITEIAEWVLEYSVSRWKLFQFVPLRGSARKHCDSFIISNESFEETVDKVKRFMGEQEQRITVSGRANIESAYFVIFPNGDIKISTGLKDSVIGNAISDNLEEIWYQGAYMRELHEERTKFIIEEGKQI